MVSGQPVFGQIKVNAETLNKIVYQTTALSKLPHGGFIFIHEI